MKTIFDRTTLKGIELKSRIIRSATWESMTPDGYVNDALIERYRELAAQDVAVLITSNTSIDPENPSTGELKLSDDTYILSHKKLTDAVHACGAKIISQISVMKPVKIGADGTVQDSDINSHTLEDIQRDIRLYGEAARRAKQAGYDGVQFHGAHGSYLGKWSNPLHNHRTDAYGGSAENRGRLLLEVYQAMRQAAGEDFLISAKLNSRDLTEGGITQEDGLVICKMLSDAGMDVIEVSGNPSALGAIKVGINEAYHLDFAIRLKEMIDTPVILVGGHRSIESMEQILNTTSIEYLAISRPLLREPDLIKRWENGDRAPSRCISCNVCLNKRTFKCVFNP